MAKNVGIAVCNFFSKKGLSTTKDNLLYSDTLEVRRGDLDRKNSFMAGDLEASELINEGLSDSISLL